MTTHKEKHLKLIVTHRLFPGAGQELYYYFKRQSSQVLLLEHSFMSYPNRISTATQFDGAKEIICNSFDYRNFPDTICYLKDFFYSLFVVLRKSQRYDLYVGCGGFNVLPGLFLKLFGRVRKVVFYTIDYCPNRFDNWILNTAYFVIDQICVKYANLTWNLSERIAEGRKHYGGLAAATLEKQRTVPVGVWLDELPASRNEIANEKILAFCGHLLESQGLELVLEAIPEIVKRVRGFKFMIIGDGPHRAVLEQLSANLGLDKRVIFKGAIYETREMLNTLATARIGVAPYLDSGRKNSYHYYADVTKPKTYFSCGLPVVITGVPSISRDVKNRKLGLVVNPNKRDLADAVATLMTDDDLYRECKTNVEKYVRSLDWNAIFCKALEDLENA